MQQPMGRPVTAKTSLPPGIPGPPLAYLLLQVTLFRSTTRRALPLKHPAVRVVWWGEDSCDGDMGCLYLDVIDESKGTIIGRGKVENLGRLTPRNPIKSVVAVANARASKIGELTVSLSYELLQGAQSHGLLKKHQSLPRVTSLPLKCHHSLASQTSISNPTINVFDTDDYNHEGPTLKSNGEITVQDNNLNKDKDMKVISLVDANNESTLSMEVVARIQSALEESRRVRQQVLAEINTDAGRVERTPAIEPNPTAINQSDDDDDDDDEYLGVEKGDFILNQPELHPSPRVTTSQPEMPFGLPDSVNSLFDDDCWDVCTDTDLERDIVIDNALLPRHDVTPQSDVNVSNRVEDLANVDRSGREVAKATKKATSANSPTPLSKKTSPDPPYERRAPPRRNMVAHQLQKTRLSNAGGGMRAKSGLQRPKTGRILQKRSSDKSPIKGMSVQGTTVPSNNSWELYMEILVPADLVEEESNTGLSFQPLIENLTLWCQRIHLCRGISKHSAPSLPTSPPSGDSMVIIVPQRGLNGDNSPMEPLVLCSNKNADLEILPIRLQILCKPPDVIPNDPVVVVGKSYLIMS
ncbi:unnamed protein product [Hydatigera taeniaeformis]|uniref:C2 NT-type domain-containing protein n=1 Tax=Hydatigena taeniaeformis TaxID=6205 RepID=A0A0R3WMD1_HYDTA|nr:unnamed protein product [Hydatigera taeniaeformis]